MAGPQRDEGSALPPTPGVEELANLQRLIELYTTQRRELQHHERRHAPQSTLCSLAPTGMVAAEQEGVAAAEAVALALQRQQSAQRGRTGSPTAHKQRVSGVNQTLDASFSHLLSGGLS